MGNPPQTEGRVIFFLFFSGRGFCGQLRVRYGLYLRSEEWLITHERWKLNEVPEVILILSPGEVSPVYHSAFLYV